MWIFILGSCILNSCQVQKQSVKETDLVYYLVYVISIMDQNITDTAAVALTEGRKDKICVYQPVLQREINFYNRSDNGTQESIQKGIPSWVVGAWYVLAALGIP